MLSYFLRDITPSCLYLFLLYLDFHFDSLIYLRLETPLSRSRHQYHPTFCSIVTVQCIHTCKHALIRAIIYNK